MMINDLFGGTKNIGNSALKWLALKSVSVLLYLQDYINMLSQDRYALCKGLSLLAFFAVFQFVEERMRSKIRSWRCWRLLFVW
jgi:hypothetical protein